MEVCDKQDIDLYTAFHSKRGVRVGAMVAMDMGFAFMPEYSITDDGVPGRPLVDPEASREVHLVRMPGRKLSPPASVCMREVGSYNWH